MELKKNLKKLINDDKITVARLSKETGVPTQTLHNWMLGAEPRSLAQVKTVADYFNVTLDALCFGENSGKNISSEKNKIEQYAEEINAGIFEVVLRKVRK
jgi:transcriptional regulator with XRE-family HTH domain